MNTNIDYIGEKTMAKVKISINTDENTKKSATELFEDLGLDMTTAINIFLKKAIAYQGIPFDVTREEPNDETIAAIEEADKMVNMIGPFNTIDELMESLNA